MPGAGDLNTRLTLQSKTVSQSTDTGAPSEAWSDVATIWAGRNVGTGREFLTSEQPRSEQRTVWTIYHRTDVGVNNRFVETDSTGNVWDISGVVDPDGRRQWLRADTVKRA